MVLVKQPKHSSLNEGIWSPLSKSIASFKSSAVFQAAPTWYLTTLSTAPFPSYNKDIETI